MVIFAFWMAAMTLCLAALALLLPPLLRSRPGSGPDRRGIERELAGLKRRRDAGEIDAPAYAAERERLSAALVAAVEAPATAPARHLSLALALALPAVTLALYFAIGRPDALNPAPVSNPGGIASPQQMEQAIAGLEQRLRANPDQLEGWLLLARSYRAVERFGDMQRASASAVALAPNSPDALVEHAEAITLNSASRRFEPPARELLEQALAVDPRHQKALWLLGIAELQNERTAEAVVYWQRLRGLLPPGDPIAVQIDEQIASAMVRGGLAAEGAAAVQPADDEAPSDDDGPRMLVTVELDPALSDRLRATDTLFVFARSPAGGPPLAIRRIEQPGLPVSVTLSQADRMLDGLQLEAGIEVAIGARISRTGQAQAASGDLQSGVQTITVGGAGETVLLRIDQVVP